MSEASQSSADRAQARRAELPEQRVTVNQLVAYNVSYYRRVAKQTQEELGERLGGWSAASVSAAERSWDGKRVRKFDADEILRIAAVLGVPVVALFMPPQDEGSRVHYVLDDLNLPESLTAAHDLFGLVMRPPDLGSPTMMAYRLRLAGLPGRYMEPLSEIEKLVEEATTRAHQITGDARARAEALERDAQERHRQAMGSLVQQREELERRVDDLRAFEVEYRSRLMAFMEGQLRDLRALGADEVWPAVTGRQGGAAIPAASIEARKAGPVPRGHRPPKRETAGGEQQERPRSVENDGGPKS